MAERGKYIVLEGNDGTGKTTQAKELARYNEKVLGRKSLWVPSFETGLPEPIQEPGGTEKANAIRLILKDKDHPLTPWEQVVLFTDARESNWNELILPALEDGVDVMTGRNYYSTVTYQGSFGIDPQDILDYTLERMGPRYMTPDLSLILAIEDNNVRRSRLQGRDDLSQKDRFESMGDDVQATINAAYLKLARKLGVKVIDATMSQAQVRDEVIQRSVPTLLS